MDTLLPARPRKGRGAIGNPTGRYEPLTRVAVADSWWLMEEETPLPTTMMQERTRSALARNQSPDIGFDRSLNPYRGCEHGCIYCYARPSHARLGLSPGLDFETKLSAKVNLADVLERELKKPGYVPATIMLGANTDAYQPSEKRLGLARQVLQVLSAFRHPVAIATKSALVCRDIDVLAPMAEARLAAVGVSITTLNPHLARVMEPRAASPKRRLATIRTLSDAGIPVAVLASPMIPFVNDHELEEILAAASAHGAREASTILLRLPHELKDLFTDWLKETVPSRADRVLARLRDSRNGMLNDPRFGSRMTGSGPYAEMLQGRFRLACQRLGFGTGPRAHEQLDSSQFRVPAVSGGQLTLF